MKICIIAAVDKNLAIGKEGHIPWDLRDDRKWFLETTIGHIVIMGRKTAESMGKTLPGRINIVLSKNPGYMFPGALICDTFSRALQIAQLGGHNEVYVAGGSDIYKIAMPLASVIFLTRVNAAIEGCNSWFPDMKKEEWDKSPLIASHTQDANHLYSFTIETYRRKQ